MFNSSELFLAKISGSGFAYRSYHFAAFVRYIVIKRQLLLAAAFLCFVL